MEGEQLFTWMQAPAPRATTKQPMPSLASSRVCSAPQLSVLGLSVPCWVRNATKHCRQTQQTKLALTHPTTEVDRAIENLAKSGKPFGPGFPPTPVGANRRESMPPMMAGGPRPYPDYGTVPAPQQPTKH